jgi:hypothetical protein
MKPYIKISLFVVLFIALFGILYGLMLFFKKHSDLSKTKPDYIITAITLQKEFEDNEAAASAKYIKKILEVSGYISSVTQADSNNVNIALKSGNDLSSVICTFALADHSKFKAGDEITIRGECSGFLMDVLLNNCAIVQKRK